MSLSIFTVKFENKNKHIYTDHAKDATFQLNAPKIKYHIGVVLIISINQSPMMNA